MSRYSFAMLRSIRDIDPRVGLGIIEESSISHRHYFKLPFTLLQGQQPIPRVVSPCSQESIILTQCRAVYCHTSGYPRRSFSPALGLTSGLCDNIIPHLPSLWVKCFFMVDAHMIMRFSLIMEQEDHNKQQLMEGIKDAIEQVVSVKELQQIKSLSVYNPDKVAKMLYLYSKGTSQTALVKKYGYSRQTVLNVLVDYAYHLGHLRDIAGKISAKNYMNISSLEEDLIEKVRDKMETDPEFDVTFRDLKELSIAKTNSFREAMTSRGEASQITEDRQVITQQDYEETLAAARSRIEKMKSAEVIEVEDTSD